MKIVTDICIHTCMYMRISSSCLLFGVHLLFMLLYNRSRWELELEDCENVMEEQNARFGIGVNTGRKAGSLN